VLQVENMGDDSVPATHNPQVHAFLATPDKTLVRIEGATHYYLDQPAKMAECIRVILDWCEARRLLS
jgi:pimeloyl-ACP methyl ester carboxylesterase